MRNKDLIESFVKYGCSGHTLSVSARNGVLYSYNTAIAQRVGDSIIVSRTKYSVTTSKHQGYVRSALNGCSKKVLWADNVPYNCNDLTDYVVKE